MLYFEEIRFRLAFIHIQNDLKMKLKMSFEDIENIFHVFILNVFLSGNQKRKYVSFVVIIKKHFASL